MDEERQAGLARAIEALAGSLLTEIPEALESEPLTAQALWLLLYALPVDEVVCPDCEGAGVEAKSVWLWTEQRAGNLTWNLRRDGWSCAIEHGRMTESPNVGRPYWSVNATRPCQRCKGPDEVCLGCGGRGRQRYVAPRPRHEDALLVPPGEAQRLAPLDLSTERECPDCNGRGVTPGRSTGRVQVHTWTDHLLGAIPLTAEQRSAAYMAALDSDDDSVTGTEHDRDLGAHRDALAVFADQLQAAGDTLGEWLSLWLVQAPCEVCTSVDPVDDFGDDPLAYGLFVTSCHACGGCGLALGRRNDDIARACIAAAVVEQPRGGARIREWVAPDPDDMHGACDGFGGQDY